MTEISKEPISKNRLERIADLIQEVGMLRHTPRTGWAFLGSNCENVAEHSFRTAIIAYLLARIAQIEPAKVVMLALFHDLHEARTGDFNYVYHQYNSTEALKALEDATIGTGFREEISAYYQEFTEATSKAALLANDADQLDLIANLSHELAKGNTFARDWLDSALPRLKTTEARELAEVLLKTDPNHWWYGDRDQTYWIKHK